VLLSGSCLQSTVQLVLCACLPNIHGGDVFEGGGAASLLSGQGDGVATLPEDADEVGSLFFGFLQHSAALSSGLNKNRKTSS
jgi:hypothetical protein